MTNMAFFSSAICLSLQRPIWCSLPPLYKDLMVLPQVWGYISNRHCRTSCCPQKNIILQSTFFNIFNPNPSMSTIQHTPKRRGAWGSIIAKELWVSTILQWMATSSRGNGKHKFDSESKRVSRKQSWMAMEWGMDLWGSSRWIWSKYIVCWRELWL